MSQLIPIYSCTETTAVADVVFVHGLNGNGYNYWKQSDNDGELWLHSLGEDLGNVNVWSFEYDAAAHIFLGEAMPLEERAENFLHLLKINKLGARPLYFVTHSMGGLVVKEALRAAATQNANNYERLQEATCGVVFLATPHLGANLATFLNLLPRVLGVSVAVKDLKAKATHLEKLNDWYRNNAPTLGIATLAFAEKKKTLTKTRVGGIIPRTVGVIVVDSVSANPQISGVNVIPVDHNHYRIAQLTRRESEVYPAICQFLQEQLSSHPPPDTFVSTLPYSPTPFFTGHDDEYAALTEQLTRGDVALTQPAALKGMGGIGKTQLALKFATEHAASFPGGVFWVPAETMEGAQQKLLEYTGRFAPELIVEQKPDVTALRFCDWLASRGKFLAIFDNADDFAPTQPYAEALTKGGRILYTTRATHLPPSVQGVEVKSLPKDKGGQLLLKCMGIASPPDASTDETHLSPQPPYLKARGSETSPTPPSESPLPLGEGLGRGNSGLGRGELLLAEAEALSERLGGLPLALDQAGAYLRETGRTIEWYTKRYEEEGAALRKKYGATDQSREHATVAVTFSLALERLESLSPASADLMRVLAFLHPARIPESMFAAGAEYLGERLEPVANDEVEWDGVVGAAQKLSLLERTDPPGYLSVHRVVQDVVKDTLNGEQKTQWVSTAIGVVQSVTPDINAIAWWQPIEVSAQWPTVINEALKASVQTTEFVYLLNAFATWQQYRGIYSNTVEYFQKALEIRTQQLGDEHPDVAASLNNLAGLLRTTGRYQEAEPLYRRALETYKAIHGDEHPDVATSLNNLAYLLQTTGRYQEAEPLYRRALEIRTQQLGDEHPDVATSLNNLAGLLEATGRYQEAEPLYRRALETYKAIHGDEHPDVATSLNNLAYLLQTTGRYQEAEPLYRRALEIRTQQLGDEHPAVAGSLNNLAGLLQTTGRYQEAEPLYRRALETYKAIHGDEHPAVATSLNNLAGLLRTTGRYQEAEPLYRRALEIRTQQLGDEHPDVAASLNNLAYLLQTTGRYQEAETYSRQAFTVILPILGNEHPHTKIMAQMWLLCLQSAQKDQIILAEKVAQDLLKQAQMIALQDT